METIWYALLGAAFATYLALGGCDYGVGLLLDRRAPEAARRATLNALGPFFLGNEVWLVVTAGLLFGAFPALEGELLSGLFPLVGAGVAGAVLVTVGIGLRSRPAGARQRAGWDALITAGSVLAAGGWGAVLGGLLQGVPPGGPTAAVLTPFTAGTGLAVLALSAAQGATFLALRLPVEAAAGHARLARALAGLAIAAVGAAAVVGVASPGVRAAVHRPLPALAVLGALVGALVVARSALRRGAPGLAFAGTSAALGLPVLLLGLATHPYAMVLAGGEGRTVAAAVAGPETLQLLGWLALPLLPVLVAAQAAGWWAFRGRLDRDAPGFF